MNLLQGKSNQYLREAILEGSVEKTRRYLTLKIGKADVGALTESGGFSMLHVASLMGNTQIVMMLLQFGADVLALTDDGYSALDLAIWKGHLQIIELLRSQGCIAPIKEPESLNGKVILHLGRRATVVDFEPSTNILTRSLRALYYEDQGEARLVNLWAGTDYKIVGFNPDYEILKKLEYQYAEIPVTQPQLYDAMLQGQAFFDNDSDSDSEDEIEEVVEVTVPPGPLGVLLDSGVQECAVVHGFTELPTGGKGPIELDGQVHAGMYIIGINEFNASLMSLQEVTQLLGRLARKEKVIRFAAFRPGSPHNTKGGSTFDGTMSEGSHSSGMSHSTLPPPAPTPAKSSTGSSFTSRFASLASAMMDRKSSQGTPSAAARAATPNTAPAAPTPTPAPAVSPREAECVYCGVPSSVHLSANCPYK